MQNAPHLTLIKLRIIIRNSEDHLDLSYNTAHFPVVKEYVIFLTNFSHPKHTQL